MRKIIIMMMVLLLGGCTETKPIPRPSFSLETYPKIYGSTVSIPLEELLMATLTEQTIETVRPYVPASKTHEAYLLLINKTADMIFVTSPSAEELSAAATAKVEFEITPITSEAFVFLVNKDNPIDSLTIEQIQKIYTGEITNWKDLGGDDVPIRAMQRPVNSGSQTGFLDLVMKGLTVMLPPVDWVSAEMGSLVDTVAAYDNKPDAIGYSYYYYVNDMKDNPNIKLLKVNGILPDSTTISNSKYPIHTNYYAVLRKDEPVESNTRNILKYLLSAEGQDLVEAAGYVKLSGYVTDDDPEYQPFPSFPKPETLQFADAHGTVAKADSQPYWTTNNVDIPYLDSLSEMTDDGVKIIYEPAIVTGLSDKAIQNKINALIEDKINELKKYAKFENLPVYSGFYAAYPEGKTRIKSASIWNWASYNSNNILSIRFDVGIEINNDYTASGEYDFTIIDSLNIDLNTGDELSLADLFVNDSDYQSALNALVLFKSNNQIDPVPEDMKWYVDTYQYVGGFTGIRGDVKFVLNGEQIILLFNEHYPEFKNDFSTTSISLNMFDMKDLMAIGQRFANISTDLYTKAKISNTRNYLYPSHVAITRETINKLNIFSQITTYDNLSEIHKTLRDQLLATDRETLSNIEDPNVPSMYYSFTASPNGPYMNVRSLMIYYDVYKYMYATYKPDGTQITLSDVFADGFDYQTYYKTLIKQTYEQDKEMYQEPLNIDAVYEVLVTTLMINGSDGNCSVTLSNEFIKNFGWNPGEFTFTLKITDDASMFKIKPWQTEPY